jgi:hypothetical protein
MEGITNENHAPCKKEPGMSMDAWRDHSVYVFGLDGPGGGRCSGEHFHECGGEQRTERHDNARRDHSDHNHEGKTGGESFQRDRNTNRANFE